jgi:hypothetical protein
VFGHGRREISLKSSKGLCHLTVGSKVAEMCFESMGGDRLPLGAVEIVLGCGPVFYPTAHVEPPGWVSWWGTACPPLVDIRLLSRIPGAYWTNKRAYTAPTRGPVTYIERYHTPGLRSSIIHQAAAMLERGIE